MIKGTPADPLREALEHIIRRLEMDIDDGSRPDQWSMEDLVRKARAALATKPAADHLEWAVERWNAEVKNRPLVNVHRRSLDDAWRQVIRHFGGDDRALIGPTHDERLAHE